MNKSWDKSGNRYKKEGTVGFTTVHLKERKTRKAKLSSNGGIDSHRSKDLVGLL